jgi:urocanate hydratase
MFAPLFVCRWVCTSGDQSDLEKTDEIAASVLEDFMNEEGD